MVSRIASDAKKGMSVALGVEAPCFIPVPYDVGELSRGRKGETNRAWSASAGAYVATLGLHQMAWVLRRLYAEFGETHMLTTDWSLWLESKRPILLLWEAFVSGRAHSHPDDPRRDAATAVHEFSRHEDNLATTNAVTCPSRICIAHAAALWSGWSSDISGLHEAMLVVRPKKAWRGTILPG
jgi:hypothetical protein